MTWPVPCRLGVSHRNYVGLVFCVVALGLSGSSLASQRGTGKQWAVLIGVTDHQDDTLDLKYAACDVQSLKEVLTQRAGLRSGYQLREYSDHSLGQLLPTSTNIKKDLPEFLKKVGWNDRVLLFFSGHGKMHNGETYFVTADYDRSRPTETSISGSWLRTQLNKCKAKTKFLIVDACQAGGIRSVGGSLSSEAIVKAIKIEEVNGCVVLASCGANEQSYECDQRQNGLFTYWLCRALEGLADDGDGKLTSDEVYNYTYQRVLKTSRAEFPGRQTPVRIINSDISGNPTLLTLRPESPDSLCRRLAHLLDVEIRENELKKVGVLDFVMRFGVMSDEQEKLTRAQLPYYCAGEIRAALEELSLGDYQVLTTDKLSNLTKGIEVPDIGDPGAMRQINKNPHSPDCLVYGSLRRRGDQLYLSCELIRSDSQRTIAEPTGLMPLSNDLVVDLMGGLQEETYNYRPSEPSLPLNSLRPEGLRIELEVLSVDASPFQPVTSSARRIPKAFYPPSALKGKGNTRLDSQFWAIKARENEVYELRITNHYDERIGFALLVDGINTNRKKRDLLSDPKHLWTLGAKASCSFKGWYYPRDGDKNFIAQKGANLNRFYFTDVANSLAGRQGFSDSLGVISAAFFRSADGGRRFGPGTGELPVENTAIKVVPFSRGSLLGSVHVQYVAEGDIINRATNFAVPAQSLRR